MFCVFWKKKSDRLSMHILSLLMKKCIKNWKNTLFWQNATFWGNLLRQKEIQITEIQTFYKHFMPTVGFRSLQKQSINLHWTNPFQKQLQQNPNRQKHSNQSLYLQWQNVNVNLIHWLFLVFSKYQNNLIILPLFTRHLRKLTVILAILHCWETPNSNFSFPS